MASLAEVRSRIEAASAAYNNEYAGKDRRTRDLERLERMLADARSIVTLLERRLGPMRPAEKELLTRARRQVELFAGECAEIAAHKKRPPFSPDEQIVVDLGARAKALNGMLRRAFATSADHVDLAALLGVAEEMDTIERKMIAAMPKQRSSWMVEALQAVREDMEACRQLHLRIVEAWSTGAVEQRREYLHVLAADAVGILEQEDRDIAAELRRLARRRHIAAAMRLITDRVRALGSLTGADADLLAMLEDRAAILDGESPHPTLAALSSELEAVNEIYRQNFAKKRREEVSLPLLRRICRRAVSATLQIFDAAEAEATADTRKRLLRARELLWIYDAEHDAVAQSQNK